MTPSHSTEPTSPRTASSRRQRREAARACDHFAQPQRSSQRAYAADHGIPRSTLGDWLRQDTPAGLDPALVRFLRSSAGEHFLRQVVLALFVVFHLRGACGLRLLGEFLRLTGLDGFVASSYGALHTFGLRLEERLTTFADEERTRLAQDQQERLIAVVADEHFHGPSPCLVAIEPVSDFILVEHYQPRRDAPTWAEAIGRGTAGLAVQVVLLTSDQARGLICCANKHLHAQHLPEMFHGQRDLARALLGPLQRRVMTAHKDWQQATERVQSVRDEQQQAQEGPARPGRPLDYTWRIAWAEAQERGRVRQLQTCEAHKQQALDAVRGLADDYHPFDAQTGRPVTAEQARERLGQRLQVLERLAEKAELPGHTREALQQAQPWLASLVAALAWFWTLARQQVEGLSLSEPAEREVYELLLPGLYWQGVARRARTASERRDQQTLAERLLQEARSTGALGRLPEAERREVERVGREVVGLFQRSSSCVEGRNGRLALFQHGHTRLSAGKLRALTAVHNYVARRAEGMTAAERFFGRKQRDVLVWLLEQMPDLPRPAARRPQKGRPQAPQAA
jgi:hypothetical protein